MIMTKKIMLLAVAAFTSSMLFAADSASPASKDVVSGFHGFLWKSEAVSLPYRLYIPAKLEEGKKYPLVVYFHGMGSVGNDNKKQLWLAMNFTTAEVQKDNPCFVLAPQCPETGRWVSYRSPSGVMYNAGMFKMAESPTPEMAMAMKIIHQAIKDYPVDLKRIYVSGPSMGGYATWDIISRSPELFAAAAPVCGGGDTANGARISGIPVWAFHGTLDPTVNVDHSRVMIEAIKKAGGNPVYTEYSEVKHNAWDYSYKDKAFYQWLFKQVKK
jgi:predicted peptidase